MNGEPASVDRAARPGGASVLRAAQRLPASSTVIVTVAAVLVVGLVDWATPGLSLSLLYVLLALLATAAAGRRAGLVLATLAAGVWAVADALSGTGTAATQAANAVIRAILLGLVVGVVHLALRELDEVARLSRTDELTGLDNTRALWQRLEIELARARRERTPLSLAYLDVDQFKEINDEHGHAAGDEVLRVIGEQLRGRTRATDLTARVGGDEFVVVLPATLAATAKEVVAELGSAITAGTAAHGCPVTLSIGIVTFEQPPGEVAALVQAADRLMYRVKREGRAGILQEVRDR